jgi:hypothetical protein
MKNSARLKELGFSANEYNRTWGRDFAGHSNMSQSENVHSDKYQSRDSDSEYGPLHDGNGEEGLIDDVNAKVIIPPS